MNFAPDGEWVAKEARQLRMVSFMEQRHFLALARQHEEFELAKRITDANKFFIRITNMVRSTDPTSRIFMKHYAAHYQPGCDASLANLLMNIVFARNTMSAEAVKMCEQGLFPWLEVENGRLTEASRKAADEAFLELGGHVFFRHVEPMRSRSNAPRRGYGELVSELVAFARKARELAALWRGDHAVQAVASEIRNLEECVHHVVARPPGRRTTRLVRLLGREAATESRSASRGATLERPLGLCAQHWIHCSEGRSAASGAKVSG